MTHDEAHYRVLRMLQDNPDISQRELADALGVSVGKAHYLLRGLIERGFVKAGNFRRSNHKLGYLYKLTPSGIREKLNVTRRYLARREAEYKSIRAEIESLRAEMEAAARSGGDS
ncbi:MarR family EPS-associated transcriptional regulator [Thioalkalivibrio denitrificans]|uniref:MarR family EPS-associated transcriptional regulator n=1 Tax=Thioalkalivibrio denitrificans TaxID=108003 RepID=A0A1V3NHA7_9GAMM|nr:MarR family EPS-associated transcriptional regulator [Thioalkalivibrio denitrificans]OOG24430.1 MarR family EPS-associated transcriptional regulator [Thioalkalivibrio denitrificans]